MRTFVVVAALLLLAVALVSARDQRRERVEALRSRANRPPHPETVSDAKAIHTEYLSRSRQIERLHGHVRRSGSGAASAGAGAGPLSSCASGANASPFLVYPSAYGADPTGMQDSTAAFEAAMNVLLTRKTAVVKMASNITDLGGATLDLEGGQYLISKPVVVPPFFGNLVIRDGTLRASSSFPANQWLLMIGNAACNPDGQGSCNEFVNVVDVLFDGNFVASGGAYIAHVMGTTLDTVFFTRFQLQGIRVDGGHEVMISQAWLAQYYWSDQHPPQQNLTSVGIQINGNDHYLRDVIVFDFTLVGVEINGAANILDGVHTWNGGGVGIAINSWQTRLIGCYLDYNYLQITDPAQTVIENTFFLETNAILVASKGVIDGLVMRFNTHYSGDQCIALKGTFTQASGVSISDNPGCSITTKAKMQQYQATGTTWTFDFSQSLLFPWIDFPLYSVTSASFTRHTMLKPNGTSVVVEFEAPTEATVFVEASQAL